MLHHDGRRSPGARCGRRARRSLGTRDRGAVVPQNRLIEYGPNSLPEKKRRSLLLLLLGQFSDFMIVVLLVAAFISGFIGEPQDTVAIIVIVLLNAVIGVIQEFRAERAVAAPIPVAARPEVCAGVRPRVWRELSR